MNTLRRRSSIFLVFGLLVSLLSCKTLLAPEYDKAIVESVTLTSEKTMSFLEKVSYGTNKDSFSEREEDYNNLIGAYNALKIKAKARPLPNNTATEKINKLLGSKGSKNISGDYPSAFAFEQIAITLKKMKETDKEKGVKETVVELFKGQIEIYLDQAITYESFLKR